MTSEFDALRAMSDDEVITHSFVRDITMASGNVIATNAYATPVFGTAASLPVVFSHGAADVSVRTIYDKDDRPVFVGTAIGTDAAGVVTWSVTHNEYDDIGNLVATMTYAQPIVGDLLIGVGMDGSFDGSAADDFLAIAGADPRNATLQNGGLYPNLFAAHPPPLGPPALVALAAATVLVQRRSARKRSDLQQHDHVRDEHDREEDRPAREVALHQ